jgi:AraC-like DNA-binding protein
MQEKYIHVISDKENHELYDLLPQKEVKIKYHLINHYKMFLVENDLGVILLDCGFKVKMGLRILRELKIKCPGVPIIFLTDTSSENTAIDAFRMGARDYYKKPVKITELRDTVERLIRVKTSFTVAQKREQSVDRRIQSGGRNFVQMKSDAPVNIIRSISFIEEKLPDVKALSLEELSKKANLSKYHFCRSFKKSTGMTPMKFVTHLRINRAKELLRRRNNNISRIAIEVGFNDFSNFIRHFKKHTGVTPKTFRSTVKS